MILLSIEGMTCLSCAAHVKEALDAIEGVNKVEVSYENASAAVTAEGGVNVADLIGAIEALGYTAKENPLPENTTPNACCTNEKTDNENTSNIESNRSQHVVIIGTGSGAFACAIKAAEGGAKVTLIEGADIIGGCCVNVGCVPSKILIRAAQLAQQQRNNPFAGLENH